MSQGAYFNIQYAICAFLAGVSLRSFFNVPDYLVFGLLGFFIAFFGVGAGTSFVRHSQRDGARQAIFQQENTRVLQNLCQDNEKCLPDHQEPQPEGPGFFSVEKTLKTRTSRAPYVLQFAVLAVVFLLGMIRFSAFENNIVKDELHNHYSETVTLDGTVISAKLTENSQRIVLQTDAGRVLITKRIYPQYKYGDRLNVKGTISEPENYGNFDVKKYLAKDNIYSAMSFPEIKKNNGEGGNVFLAWLFSIKDKFEDNLKKILPEPHALLADGMLLGNQSALDKDLLEDFRRSGTIHILVLSGYNITIVGAFVFGLSAAIFPEIAAWMLAILAILAFTLMSGAEAAAVRSAIMAIIGLVALRSGRKNTALLALLWAAFLMVLWNPMLLRFDRGFQLSFLATLGLITASSYFKRLFSVLPDAGGFRESAASAFSAQIFVMPLILSWGGIISWLSPVANILIVGIVPFVMLFSFLGGLSAFISLFLGKIIISVAYFFISYQLYLVKFFGSLDFSMIHI